jgi:hypothetical protein
MRNFTQCTMLALAVTVAFLGSGRLQAQDWSYPQTRAIAPYAFTYSSPLPYYGYSHYTYPYSPTGSYPGPYYMPGYYYYPSAYRTTWYYPRTYYYYNWPY